MGRCASQYYHRKNHCISHALQSKSYGPLNSEVQCHQYCMCVTTSKVAWRALKVRREDPPFSVLYVLLSSRSILTPADNRRRQKDTFAASHQGIEVIILSLSEHIQVIGNKIKGFPFYLLSHKIRPTRIRRPLIKSP